MYQAYATIELFIEFSNFWLGGWEIYIQRNETLMGHLRCEFTTVILVLFIEITLYS